MNQTMSDQNKIWNHFQNDGVDSFALAHGRQEYLVRRLKSGMRVLNIGVGSGYLEGLAAAKGVDIYSLDPNEQSVERLRLSLGVGDKAQVGYCQKIPFNAELFDVVIMSEVLEHLDEDVFQQTITEVKRVLRKDGRFIGTVPAREKLEISLVVCPTCGDKFHRWGHKRSFDVEMLRSELRTKFVVDKIYEHYFVDWASVGVKRKFQGILKKILSWANLGTYGTDRNIYFCAVKTGLIN